MNWNTTLVCKVVTLLFLHHHLLKGISTTTCFTGWKKYNSPETNSSSSSSSHVAWLVRNEVQLLAGEVQRVFGFLEWIYTDENSRKMWTNTFRWMFKMLLPDKSYFRHYRSDWLWLFLWVESFHVLPVFCLDSLQVLQIPPTPKSMP